MALFRINALGRPLVQSGTVGSDVFQVVTPNALLIAGLQQSAGLGEDDLQVFMGVGGTLTDAHFAGLSGFEGLRLMQGGTKTVTLGALAEAAFGPWLEVRLGSADGVLDLDASTLGAATGLRAFGLQGNDSVAGGGGDDELIGGGGRDLLAGGAGADTLLGGKGADTLRGDAGHDRLVGGTENDSLQGGSGQDTLQGGAGDDTLDGGADADLLLGGGGADVFVLGAGGGSDAVGDFSVAEDVLDVSALGIRTFGEVLGLARQVGPNTVFTFTDGSTVRLRGVVLTNLGAEDFVFATGTAPTDLYFASGGALLSGGRGVGIVGATDADAGDLVTYSVDDRRFEFIFGATLVLKDGEPAIESVDEEAITLTITATDSFGLTYSEQFIIDVLTPGIDTNDLSLAENRAIGTQVGAWFETGFAPVGTLEWEVVTPGTPFAFDGNRLVTTAVLDFETAPSHVITVRATDPGTGRVVERTVTVIVEDQGDTNLVVTLERSFTGARGEAAGSPGQSLDETLFTAADNPVGTVLPDVVVWNGLVEGGMGEASNRAGGNGGDAIARVTGAGAQTGVAGQVAQDQVRVSISAIGGDGGWTSGGPTAGSGGLGFSEVTPWNSAATADTDLVFDIRAEGGQGSNGWFGAVYAGGDGGEAVARLDGLSTFASGGMNATIFVTAIGGHGGLGGTAGTGASPEHGSGGHATAQISSVAFGGYAPDNDDTLVRLEATATGGLGGTRGGATINLLSNVIELAAGDDTLAIATFFDGATHTLNFSGNRFEGQDGRDTLDLSGVYGGFGATIDLRDWRNPTLALGGSPVNDLRGFEEFRGTESDDRFLDGEGAQVYRGGSGADVFVFGPGLGSTHDSIGDFTQGEDLIDLEAYTFTDFAEVTIVYGGEGTPADPAFAVVVLDGGGSSISISFGTGPTPAMLTASDFLL